MIAILRWLLTLMAVYTLYSAVLMLLGPVAYLQEYGVTFEGDVAPFLIRTLFTTCVLAQASLLLLGLWWRRWGLYAALIVYLLPLLGALVSLLAEGGTESIYLVIALEMIFLPALIACYVFLSGRSLPA